MPTLLEKPNVLPLDEPTHHLNLESINALNIALQRYEGTVLLVTHDHGVIDEEASRIWSFADGAIEDFQGPYVASRRWRGAGAGTRVNGAKLIGSGRCLCYRRLCRCPQGG